MVSMVRLGVSVKSPVTNAVYPALIIMYLAGWVHRDISGGNILWYVDQTGCGRGILSDLEYAKKPALEGGSADPKTVIAFYHTLLYLFHAQ